MTLPKFSPRSLLLFFSLFSAVFSSSAGRDVERGPRELVFLGGASGVFDRETNPAVTVEYRSGLSLARFRPWLALGWATDGAVFAGGGALRSWTLGEAWSFTAGFGAGRYDRHEGRDLGSHLEFLTYGEISRRVGAGRSVLLRLTHISNGSLGDVNPGTELVTIGYSVVLP